MVADNQRAGDIICRHRIYRHPQIFSRLVNPPGYANQ